MTNEQILKKCIEKAVESSWKMWWTDCIDKMLFIGGTNIIDIDGMKIHLYSILFDHSFLMAMTEYLYISGKWKLLDRTKWDKDDLDEYKYLFDFIEEQLKVELVLSKDRLKYMEQFIK